MKETSDIGLSFAWYIRAAV